MGANSTGNCTLKCVAMAKRMRSLASVLWDTDLEASDQEAYQIQEVDAFQKKQETREREC